MLDVFVVGPLHGKYMAHTGLCQAYVAKYILQDGTQNDMSFIGEGAVPSLSAPPVGGRRIAKVM